MRNKINFFIKNYCARHYNEKYNQFPYQNPSQGITMRNLINSLMKTNRNALQWVSIRELIILLIVMLYMGCDKEIDYISHRYSLRWDLIRELIIFLFVMPCDGF